MANPATDLFAEAVACHREERAGILEFDAGIPREAAEAMAERSSEQFRHECEVRNIADRYRKAAEKYGHEKAELARDKFLAEIAGHRGKAAADRLRNDALALLNNQR